MSGRTLMIGLLAFSLIFGGVLWYFQTRAFYVPVDSAEIRLTLRNGGTEPMQVDDFEGIDANTSPLKFRACFSTPMRLSQLTETYEIYTEATPLKAPPQFGCFDYVSLTEAIEAGDAVAFLSERDIKDGVDRIVAVYQDGRAFAWHQLNEKYAE